ncbi:MAG: ABC transporter ATP-binding protein [Spirochaetaceae bacterium]|jgi:peptide/nickel transport system ATP-binding protein|nr:ABC transporter ATP-binding protein [Spirochaetaceae bacterium]
MLPLLRVQNLSVGIKRNREYLSAVDDISFRILPGEIVGIVGESGCGKSLTALSIPALLPQGVQVTGGSIIFDGRDIGGLSGRELCRIRGNEISMVFQEPMTSLNPLLKIGPQIAEPLELHGQKNRKRIADEVRDIMQKVGLPNPEKLIREYPHQLSGGMRQRVMIALAMVNKPKLLIADEPVTALDVTIQAQILRLMKRINRDFGTSILFISHDLGVINRICDRVLVMYAGKVVEEGTVRSIFFHPLHEYTKGLIGSIPTREGKGKPLAQIPGKVPSIEEKGQSHFSGCPFAPRCARAWDRCFAAFPEAVPLGENHSVRCILVNPESEMEYVRI